MADLRIFGKTNKGTAEVITRTAGLTLGQRRLLILIDGVRNIDELAPFVPTALDESLRVLEAGGYIILLGHGVGVPERLPNVSMDIPVDELTTVQEAKMRAVRALVDLLGPDADDLALSIEAAGDGDELRPLIREAERLVSARLGRTAAAAFLVGIRRR